METSPRSFLNYDEYRPQPAPLSMFLPSRGSPRPIPHRSPPIRRSTLYSKMPADRCQKLIDRTEKFLQMVRENQHRVSKHLFTRITGETNELLRTLVMWEKHKFSEEPLNSHEIEQLLNKRPTFTDLCHVLLPKLAPMWKAFCTVINFDDDGTTLAIIDQKYHGDPEECCREVLRRWLWFKRPTWQKVIDYLQQAKCSQLACDVEEMVVPHLKLGCQVATKHTQLNMLWHQYMNALWLGQREMIYAVFVGQEMKTAATGAYEDGKIVDALFLGQQEMKTAATGAYEDGKIVKIYNGGEKLTAVDTTIEDDLMIEFIELKGQVAAFFEHEASEILKRLKKKTSSAGAGREWHTLGELLISLRFVHGQVGG